MSAFFRYLYLKRLFHNPIYKNFYIKMIINKIKNTYKSKYGRIRLGKGRKGKERCQNNL